MRNEDLEVCVPVLIRIKIIRIKVRRCHFVPNERQYVGWMTYVTAWLVHTGRCELCLRGLFGQYLTCLGDKDCHSEDQVCDHHHNQKCLRTWDMRFHSIFPLRV